MVYLKIFKNALLQFFTEPRELYLYGSKLYKGVQSGRVITLFSFRDFNILSLRLMLSACKSKQISQKLDKHSGASAIRERSKSLKA